MFFRVKWLTTTGIPWHLSLFFLKKNKIEWLKTELESSESPTISTKALNAERFEQKSQLFQKRLMSKPEKGREKNIFLLSPTIIWCSQE